MANKLIEFVCNGNRGRSPVAEVIANMYLRQKDIDADCHAISSGAAVSQIDMNSVALFIKLKIIEIAKQRDVYASVEIPVLDCAIEKNETKLIKHFYDVAVAQFSEEELRFRSHIPQALGIDAIVKVSRDQTVARPGTLAVYSMAELNNRKVHKIYNASYHQHPVMDVLSRYATGNPEAEIPNTFGMPIENYIAAVKQMMKEVPLAIDRLLMEQK